MRSEEDDEEEEMPHLADNDADQLDEEGDQSVYEAEEDFPHGDADEEEQQEEYRQYGNSASFSTDEMDAYNRLMGSVGLAPRAPAGLQLLGTAAPAAPARAAAAQAEADPAAFSPSSAVFHSHTLPFALPNAEEIQMQRRISATAAIAQPVSHQSMSQTFLGGGDRMLLL